MATKPIANAYEVTLQIVETNQCINEDEEYIVDDCFFEIFSEAANVIGLSLVACKVRSKKLGGF